MVDSQVSLTDNGLYLPSLRPNVFLGRLPAKGCEVPEPVLIAPMADVQLPSPLLRPVIGADKGGNLRPVLTQVAHSLSDSCHRHKATSHSSSPLDQRPPRGNAPSLIALAVWRGKPRKHRLVTVCIAWGPVCCLRTTGTSRTGASEAPSRAWLPVALAYVRSHHGRRGSQTHTGVPHREWRTRGMLDGCNSIGDRYGGLARHHEGLLVARWSAKGPVGDRLAGR
jgi:hypothetical protein